MSCCGSLGITKSPEKQQRKKIVPFVTKVLWQTVKSETCFRSHVLVVPNWEMNPDQEAHQTLLKMLLRKFVECNLHKSTQELALDLNKSQSTICRYLKKIVKVSNLGVSVPHTLKLTKNGSFMIRVNIKDSGWREMNFVLNMELHGRKVKLRVWWKNCGIICFEFLNRNQTLNVNLDFHAHAVAFESLRITLHSLIKKIKKQKTNNQRTNNSTFCF